MNALLDPARKVVRDLVDKKLWPVALLLLVAVVAVPVAIGSSAAPAPEPQPPAATTPAPGDGGERSLVTAADQSAGAKAERPGKLVDPFYDPPDPPKPAETLAGAGGAVSAPQVPSAPAGGPSAPSKPAPAPAIAPKAPATAPAPAAAPAPRSSYLRTELRWSHTKRAEPRPVLRLTPLGGSADPAVLYLGIRRPRSAPYAVFLLGPNSASAGDGACEDRACRTVRMRAGERRIVDVRSADGSAGRAYRLEVERIRTVSATAEHARTQRARVHADGREAMRAMWQDRGTAAALGPFSFDAAAGLLERDGAKGSG